MTLKHIFTSGVLIFSIVIAAVIWDKLFATELVHLLMNVDFLIDYTVRQPSFLEEFFYHCVTTCIIYGLFMQLVRTKLYTLALLIFTLFSSTALYFILQAQAVRPFHTGTLDFVGWVVIHVIFALLLYLCTKKARKNTYFKKRGKQITGK